MKNIFLALLVLAVAAPAALAQMAKPQHGYAPQAANPAAPKPAMPVVTKVVRTAKGVVDSVSAADVAKGTKAEIAVTSDAGAKEVFLVKSTTTIYGADTNAIVLNKITKGEKVRVKYDVTKEGVNEAFSIHVIK